MRRKFIHFLWFMIALVALVIVVGFFSIWFGLIGYMPDIEDLQNPISKYASIVYSADGKQLGTYNQNQENRIMVSYDQLPTGLVAALVATEDERFYEHSGIDFIALGRAVLKRGIMGKSSAGGGSTITQQLAKQLYSEKAHNTMERLLQKPIEWVIAIKLERFFTKEEIIAMYLNYFDFLHNAVGIKIAAKTYFNKEPIDLTLVESSLLVGLCKNPSYYNPVRYPERSKERRNVVLSQMVKSGYLSQAECNAAQAEPVELHFHRADHKEGYAPYFRDFLRRYMMATKPDRKEYFEWNQNQYEIDSIAWETDPLYGWCNKNTKRNGKSYNIYTDGLRIYTTIDTRMQKYAEDAVYQHVVKDLQPAFNRENRYKANAPYSSTATKATIKNILERSMRQTDRYRALKKAGATEEEIRKSFNTPVDMSVFTYHGEIDTVMSPMDSIRYYKRFLRAGFMSMDAHTGAVKAYVGGVNYEYFQYDMVNLGRRQVGSTAKPYLYALSLEHGYTPCDVVPCQHHNYGKWAPRGSAHGMVTLKWGLQQSNNLVTAYLMSRLVPNDYRQCGVVYLDMLNKFGVNTPGIQPSLPLCLGAYEASVREMVSAYTAFANHGIRNGAMFVTKIEDSNGEVIAEFQPIMQEVISEDNSYKMIDMMRAVIDNGTGARMRHRYNIKCDMGGKTGTTNDNSDGWFIGFTPRLVSGGWVGGEDRDIHFDNASLGQGAHAALPIWAYFMKKVFADRSLGYSEEEKFDIPEGYDPCGRASGAANVPSLEDVFE
ncbi:MAG: transglycosylase domain-containing protein [Prevotella sp.]|nr:transglycosylase domain-containing protein [Prevotella sp.]